MFLKGIELRSGGNATAEAAFSHEIETDVRLMLVRIPRKPVIEST